jgi:choline dehydrogenase-like flavoprotein
MLELIRETVKFQQESTVSKYLKRSIIEPKSTSSQELISGVASPLWHANGTIKMGPPSDPTACVDSKFRVYGIESLRVANMSVAPLTVKYALTQPNPTLENAKSCVLTAYNTVIALRARHI